MGRMRGRATLTERERDGKGDAVHEINLSSCQASKIINHMNDKGDTHWVHKHMHKYLTAASGLVFCSENLPHSIYFSSFGSNLSIEDLNFDLNRHHPVKQV